MGISETTALFQSHLTSITLILSTLGGFIAVVGTIIGIYLTLSESKRKAKFEAMTFQYENLNKNIPIFDGKFSESKTQLTDISTRISAIEQNITRVEDDWEKKIPSMSMEILKIKEDLIKFINEKFDKKFQSINNIPPIQNIQENQNIETSSSTENLAWTLFQKREFKLSKDKYLLAADEDPSNPSPVKGLAMCEEQLGNYASSLNYAKKALELAIQKELKNDELCYYYSMMGNILNRIGDNDKALENFIHSYNLSKNIYVAQTIQTLLITLNKYNELIEFINNNNLNTNILFQHNLAYAYFKLNLESKSLEIINEIINRNDIDEYFKNIALESKNILEKRIKTLFPKVESPYTDSNIIPTNEINLDTIILDYLMRREHNEITYHSLYLKLKRRYNTNGNSTDFENNFFKTVKRLVNLQLVDVELSKTKNGKEVFNGKIRLK